MRDSMIGYRRCAFALSAALVVFCSTPPAIAGAYDGNWRMLAVTTNGHCGKIKIGLGIDGNRIQSTSGSFVFHRIHLVGRIAPSGHTSLNAVAGPRIAKGTGRFTRTRATGKWSGTGPSGVCSGFWNAERK